MNGHALDIAIAIGKEGVVDGGVVGERVTGSRLSVGGQAMHATGIVICRLSTIHFATVADGNVQVSIAVEFHAACKMAACGTAGQGFENHFHVG
jgi:hypothetical protein